MDNSNTSTFRASELLFESQISVAPSLDGPYNPAKETPLCLTTIQRHRGWAPVSALVGPRKGRPVTQERDSPPILSTHPPPPHPAATTDLMLLYDETHQTAPPPPPPGYLIDTQKRGSGFTV